MQLGDKVYRLLKNQKDLIKEYEEIFKEINLDDSIHENIEIKKERQLLKENLENAAKIKSRRINQLVVILLLFGVATAMKYTYSEWFNDYMKGISGFLLGGAILAGGEWFNRKEKNLFVLGLCGGGIRPLSFYI